MEKKILRELRNITRELKVIAKNTRKDTPAQPATIKTIINGSHLLLCDDDVPLNTICQGKDGYEYFVSEKSNGKITEATRLNRMDYKLEAQEKELIYNQDDAIEFIYNKTGEAMKHYSKEGIREILETDENYMRSVGIIED